MYSLDEVKKILGDDYAFRQSKTVEEVKRILETGEMDDNDTVPFVLEAGNLDIEINIYFDEGSPPYLMYYCCVRKDGFWDSYGDIDDRVNLDAPNLEAEMYRVLAKFAEEYSLSFFDQAASVTETKPAKNQNGLMAKVEAAIKNGNVDEERISAKWGLLRGLEVAPSLSHKMIDFLYGKDDVTEEMLEFVIEQSGDEFSYDQIDFYNVQEIACEYLDSLEHQMLARELYERAEQEMAQFLQALKHDVISPDVALRDDSIISRAYQLTIMNEILCYFEDAEEFDTDELKALLTIQNPLDSLYDVWMDCDVNIKDEIIEVVNNSVRDLARDMEDDEQNNFETEDEEDMER